MDLKSYRITAQTKYSSVIKEDIDRIVAQVCHLPRLELMLHDMREINADEDLAIQAFLKRRAQNEPLQYIFAEAFFRDYSFLVGKGVLIPRPETEMLVDLALQSLPDNASILDLGTGTGAVAISIALERMDSQVTAVDISEKALYYARKNIDKYQPANITLLQSDLFSGVKGKKFQIITANLPYVAESLYEELDGEVRRFEPESALLSGDDGLELIRKTAATAKEFLSHLGKIIFEFSPEQEQAIIDIMNMYGYNEVKIIKDLNNRARFAIARC